MRARLIMFVLASVCMGCEDRAASPSAPPVPTAAAATTAPADPIPLRDDDHMRSYLTGRWRITEESTEQYWYFTEQGDFKVWIRGGREADLHNVHPDAFPPGTVQLGGTWSATSTRLSLNDMAGPDVVSINPATISLAWVDGRREIEIGDRRYRRVE